MSVKNGGIANGTRIVQASKTTSVANGLHQLWKIHYLGSGKYSFRPMHKLNLGIDCTSDSSVAAKNIGTTENKLSDVDTYALWSIYWVTDGYVFKSGQRIGYALCSDSSTNGDYVNLQSHVVDDAFNWTFEKNTEPISNQLRLYNTSTSSVVDSPTRIIRMGETQSLDDLELTTAFVSLYSIDQSITWSTDSSSVSVDRFTGAVIGLIGDRSATITATHTHNGIDYQTSYTVQIMPIPNGTYFIRNAASDKNVGIGGTLQGSATTRQMSFTGSDTQRWVFTHLGDCVYSIKSAASSTAYYMGVTGNTSSSGQLITIQTGSLTSAKKWNIRFTENGTYVLSPQSGSSNDLVLAVATGATESGTVIQQLTYTDDNNYEDEWMLCPQKDYTLMYLGAYPGDPQMIPILESVDGELTSNSFSGYASTSMKVIELLEHMASSSVVSCITHGEQAYLVCTGGNLTIEMVEKLDSSAFDNLVFVYLGACLTGQGGTDADNLVNAIVEQGADNVLGFKVSVIIAETNFWTKRLMLRLSMGATIGDAMAAADAAILTNDRFSGKTLTVTENNRYFVGNKGTVPFD